MTSQPRHTEPMTDAYITGLRLRNAARVAVSIQNLGDAWLLHPDHASTKEKHLETRRARAERVDLRRIRDRLEAHGFTSVCDAFKRAGNAFALCATPERADGTESHPHSEWPVYQQARLSKDITSCE